MFNFTKDCFVGVVNIDKKRIEYFETLNYALNEDGSEDYSLKLKNILDRLNSYVVEGFREEEEYMTKTADKELELQVKEHRWFLEKFNEFKKKYTEITEETVEEELNKLIRFMIKWLYSHIVSKDTLISKPASVNKNKADEKEENGPFAFTNKYVIGVEHIDAEHRRLFEIVKEANEVLHNDFIHDKYDQIINILENLVEYTKVHFADEEAYMESINYDGLEAQKKAHAMFIEKVENINLEEVDENQDEYLGGLLNFLLDWLVNHILKMDKLIPAIEQH